MTFDTLGWPVDMAMLLLTETFFDTLLPPPATEPPLTDTITFALFVLLPPALLLLALLLTELTDPPDAELTLPLLVGFIAVAVLPLLPLPLLLPELLETLLETVAPPPTPPPLLLLLPEMFVPVDVIAEFADDDED